MKYVTLCLLCLIGLAACESRPLNTAQNLTVDVIGTDGAYCILHTKYNRYALYAPDTAVIERSPEELTVDCRGTAGRRRVVTIHSEIDELYYRYPEKVIVDFTTIDNGNRYNGFRGQSSSKHTGHSSHVMTESSFSQPIRTSQQYPVPKQYVMGRHSYPIAAN